MKHESLTLLLLVADKLQNLWKWNSLPFRHHLSTYYRAAQVNLFAKILSWETLNDCRKKNRWFVVCWEKSRKITLVRSHESRTVQKKSTKQWNNKKFRSKFQESKPSEVLEKVQLIVNWLWTREMKKKNKKLNLSQRQAVLAAILSLAVEHRRFNSRGV